MIWEIAAVIFTSFIELANGLYRSSYRGYSYRTYYYRTYYTYYTYYYRTYSATSTTSIVVGAVFGCIALAAGIITLICCCIKTKGRTGRVISSQAPTVSYINPTGPGQATVITTPTSQGQTTVITSPAGAPPPYSQVASGSAAYPPPQVQYAPPGSQYPPPGSQYPPMESQYPPMESQYPPVGSQYPPVGSQYPPMPQPDLTKKE